MLGFSETPRAWWLTRGMARLIGLNLPRAVMDGWISRDDLSDMVMACATCRNQARCEAWLAAQASANVLPAFCANKSALEALALH